MKKTALLLLVLISSAVGFSQSTIVSTGGAFANTVIASEWHLGELSSASFNNGGIIMSNGSLGGSYTVIISSVGEIQNPIELSSYPNPVAVAMYVECDRNLKMDIYNASGSLMKSSSITFGQNTIQLDDLSAGVYIVKFTDKDKKVVTKRIVKQ